VFSTTHFANASSVVLLDQMKASPGRRFANFSGVSPDRQPVEIAVIGESCDLATREKALP
jgi:hypothetical protein